MYQTIDNAGFHQAFKAYGRETQFSPAALDLLFEYFTDLEDHCGESFQLDVIAICCDFVECTLEEFDCDYQMFEKHESLEDLAEDLADETQVVGCTDDTIIFQQF
jgi:hypothetical protein